MLIIELVSQLRRVAADASPEVRAILERAIDELVGLWKERVATMGGGE